MVRAILIDFCRRKGVLGCINEMARGHDARGPSEHQMFE
jgi:hypothetical protein